jgi:hypothetical protein
MLLVALIMYSTDISVDINVSGSWQDWWQYSFLSHVVPIDVLMDEAQTLMLWTGMLIAE